MSVVSTRIANHREQRGGPTASPDLEPGSLEQNRSREQAPELAQSQEQGRQYVRDPKLERDYQDGLGARSANEQGLDRDRAEEQAREERELADPKLEASERGFDEPPDHDPEHERAAELEAGDRGARDEWTREQDRELEQEQEQEQDRDRDLERGMGR